MQRSGPASFFGIEKWYKELEFLIYSCLVVRNRGSSIVFEHNAGIHVCTREAKGRCDIFEFLINTAQPASNSFYW